MRYQRIKNAHQGYQPEMRNVSPRHEQIVTQSLKERLQPYATVIIAIVITVVALAYSNAQHERHAYMQEYRASVMYGVSIDD